MAAAMKLADRFGVGVVAVDNAFHYLWGGGFEANSTPESYLAGREKALGYLSHLSMADQAKVAGGTAARLFKFI